MSFPKTARHADETDIIYPAVIPFALVHLACLAVIWTGFQASDLMLCGALYALRMFAITGGYHRYFSHRSFKTSRVFQFLLAFVAQSSAQQGALWWAAHHRKHHKYSDTPQDVHSPLQHGFWFAHFGWIFSPTKSEADYNLIKDFMKFPELVWLNKYKHVPPALLESGCGWFPVGLDWWSVSSSVRCSSFTAHLRLTRWLTLSANSLTSPGMTRATTGFWHSSPLVKDGTTTTTIFKVQPAKGSIGGRSI